MGRLLAGGEKAFATNASDIAAMGAEPTFALLQHRRATGCDVEELDDFFAGFLRAAERSRRVIGGNLSAAPCFYDFGNVGLVMRRMAW